MKEDLLSEWIKAGCKSVLIISKMYFIAVAEKKSYWVKKKEIGIFIDYSENVSIVIIEGSLRNL